MFKHILVPLDGSALAEVVLPAAAYMARVFQARVTLLHVIAQDAAMIHSERHLTLAEEAQTYLREVAGRAFAPEIPVECHVRVEAASNVPRAIVEYQSELSPDGIVMCTHGQSGLRKMLFGNIAQQVVASRQLPLLLIRPGELPAPTSFACDTILAPTDGEPEHEEGLGVACQLARLTEAKLQLLSVVPTAGVFSEPEATTQRLMPVTTATILEMTVDDLRDCLHDHMARMEEQGVAVSAEIRRGEPASVIAEVAETSKVSLIVLGVHGKTGAEAFWRDSTGAKVIARTKRPLLLIPVRAAYSIMQ